MRSASHTRYRAALLTAFALLLAVAVAGCQTTQETAALKQAESKRILEKRERRHRAKAHDKGSEKR